ncbi:protein Mis18-beta [Xyrichtys novacula]|uniref:Protein Mis18-beta n=1 Tax=Xyrichtys novacula TaxID=13765 RepID=A0AAV1GQC9_XYRNO|nr:protein Mis18-beta [Xyrichtys novacula]
MEFDGSVLIKCRRDVKPVTEFETNLKMTLHCQQCITVLGDSFSICGEVKSMNAILCTKVTDDVVISDAKQFKQKGDLSKCIYSSLKCRSCHMVVGKVIHSSPSHLAAIRSIFLLHKSNISCYILNSSSMVKASTFSFDLMGMKDSMSEVKEQFEAQLGQMSRIKRILADRSAAM